MIITIDKEFQSLIPELSEEEKRQLEENLKSDGCRDALITWNGILVDGHNRYEICERLKIAYKTTTLDLPDREAAKEWIECNQLGRRNLSPDWFRYLLGRLYERTKKAQGGTGANQYQEQKGQNDPSANTAEKLATEHGVSRETVKRAAKFSKEVDADPDLKKAMRENKSVSKAKRDIKEAKRETKRQENAKKVSKSKSVKTLVGVFSTILIDPPWDWSDEGDINQMGRAKPDYATMTQDQLSKFPVSKWADTDCHLYCWVTNRSMPKVFGLMDAWGFRYVVLLTWPKASFGLGNYFRGQTEHIAFGIKGSQGLKRKNASTLLPTWARGKGHSSKPKEIYEFIETCSPGPYLEVFGRGKPRDGWVVTGEGES